MTSTLKLTATAALAGAVSLAALAAAHGGSDEPLARMSPSNGISFDVGAERGVSYFVTDNGACNLVVLLASASEADQPTAKTASRVSVAVGPGRVARIDTTSGKTLLFGCQPGASAMTVYAADQVALARPVN